MKCLPILVILCCLSLVTCASANGQCRGGHCGVQLYAVSPMVYRPVIYYQPMQYAGTSIQRKEYKTPIRDLFFGRYRVQHYYSPVMPQQQPATVQQPR